MTVEANNEKFQIPHDLDSEKAIIGAMLFDIVSCEIAIQGLQSDYFFEKKNAAMFIEIIRIRTEGADVNLETISALPSLRQVKSYITEIASEYTTSRGII